MVFLVLVSCAPHGQETEIVFAKELNVQEHKLSSYFGYGWRSRIENKKIGKNNCAFS